MDSAQLFLLSSQREGVTTTLSCMAKMQLRLSLLALFAVFGILLLKDPHRCAAGPLSSRQLAHTRIHSRAWPRSSTRIPSTLSLLQSWSDR